MSWAELRLAVTLLTVIPLPDRRADSAAAAPAAPEPAGAAVGLGRAPEAAPAAAGTGPADDGVASNNAAGGASAGTGAARGRSSGQQSRDGLAGNSAAAGVAADGGTAPGIETAGDLRRLAGAAMEWAPAVGLVLGLVGVGVLWLAEREGRLGPLLSSVLAIAALAGLTGGLHLDGLADLADGLGSRRPAEDALAIMKKSDIGPFGVVALVLVLLVQVAALARAVSMGRDAVALVAAVVTARLAMTAACRRGVPAARDSGLGALVAGSVPRPAVAGLVVADLAAAAAFGWVFAVGVAAGLLASAGLTAVAVHRLGGITGDVLGAIAEVTMAVCLLFCLVR